MKGRWKTIGSVFLLSLLLIFMALHGLMIPTSFLNKLPQLVTIFLSIIIQALPFVLVGVFGSALMHHLITAEMIENRLVRTKKLPGILMAIGAGFFFPVCDCGVIPVARRLLAKKVPPYMAIAFLVTAPLVNPITVWATATAFGYNLPVTLIRVGMAVIVGVMAALLVDEFFPKLEDLIYDQAIRDLETAAVSAENPAMAPPHHHESMITAIFNHATTEFLEVGKFLIIGALVASTIQTAVPKQSLLAVSGNPAISVLIMMALALSLSLCAEADAFVARSFTYHFPLGSVMGFMVLGQMIDIKNTALLLKSFKLKAILFIFGLCALLVFAFCLLLNLSGANNLIRGRL